MAAVNVEKLSKCEILKLLEKCKKERDDAIQKENILREKLRQHESRAHGAEELKRKMKKLCVANRALRKAVKGLRADLGLESSPKFQGKTTRDIIYELHEKERQCGSLKDRNGKLTLAVNELRSQLANTVTSKTILEEELQALQQNLKDMTNNQRRLLKLWQDKKAQREALFLPAISLRAAPRSVSHKAAQTDKLPRPSGWEPEKTKTAELLHTERRRKDSDIHTSEKSSVRN